MKMFNSKNGILYFQPENIDDVKSLILSAITHKKKIVIQGAKHSFPLTDNILKPNASYIYVLLTYLNKVVKADFDQGIFTVQAGCRLGYDPFDETQISTLSNSLVYQLDPVNADGTRSVPPGWSLPELGGITHQTIGGFIATGSAGGSTKYAFCDTITAIRILYFNGKEIVDTTFYRPTDKDDLDNEFWAVGYANLGLLGFMVEVNFTCQRAFNVRGCETTSQTKKNRVEMYPSTVYSKKSLNDFMREDDYTRILYWPQKQINKVLIWSANQEPINDWQNYKPHAYHSLPIINGSTEIANKLFGEIFHFLGCTLVKMRKFVIDYFGKTAQQKNAISRWFEKLNISILKVVLGVVAPNGKKNFDDAWWRALPMDNEYSDKFAPVKFTELWMPIRETGEVLNRLNEFYKKPENAGTFCSEIYPGKANNFWLSPGYGTDTIRVDVFWFGRNIGDPEDYFKNFWGLFKDMDFRSHWGKYIGPMDNKEHQFLIKRSFPKWKQFMDLRWKHDPNEIFLNEYWKTHLDIS